MSYIGESRRSNSSPWEYVICLSTKEAATLLPLLEKRLEVAEERVEHYSAIHEVTDLTAAQDIHWTKWEDEKEVLESIIEDTKKMIKQDGIK